MSEHQWAQFTMAARRALVMATGLDSRLEGSEFSALLDNVETHNGTGRYGDVVEDSRHVSLYTERGMGVDRLRELASILASLHEQDSVALIVGSELVTA